MQSADTWQDTYFDLLDNPEAIEATPEYRQMIASGLSKDIAIKLSVWAGVSSAAGAKLAQDLGASSFNPVSDLTLPQMAGIRKVVDIPIDFYIWTFDSYGGANRLYDAPEVAKIYGPCYFKFEPAPTAGFYNPFNSDEEHARLMEKKVKWAEWAIRHVEANEPEVRLSPHGAADLHFPKP